MKSEIVIHTKKSLNNNKIKPLIAHSRSTIDDIKSGLKLKPDELHAKALLFFALSNFDSNRSDDNILIDIVAIKPHADSYLHAGLENNLEFVALWR